VIASHFAEALACRIALPMGLHETPSAESPLIRELGKGEPFALLDDSFGWAWGYAGKERRVGYVRSNALGD
jgi:hypothetical protein